MVCAGIPVVDLSGTAGADVLEDILGIDGMPMGIDGMPMGIDSMPDDIDGMPMGIDGIPNGIDDVPDTRDWLTPWGWVLPPTWMEDGTLNVMLGELSVAKLCGHVEFYCEYRLCSSDTISIMLSTIGYKARHTTGIVISK